MNPLPVRLLAGAFPLLVFLIAMAALSACGPSESDPSRRAPGADAVTDRVPEWSRNAVWYQLFPERFRNGDPSNDPTRASLEFPGIVPTSWRISPWTGDWYARDAWEREMGVNFYEDGVFHRRYGGDLQGVLDKLDYLADLGITAIYFNPVFFARSLHKYDGASFHHIDPYFGPDPAGDLALIAGETAEPVTWQWTAADRLFLQIIEEAHARGIRIVIDGVFNHTGRDFFAFRDLLENQEASPYREWYIIKAFDDEETPEDEFAYKGWWDVETLPEFANNTDETDLHPGPKAYIFEATRRWMDPNADGDPSDGIDGWRLDVAEEVPIGFWKDWNDLVFRINPDAYTVTEIWNDASAFLAEGGFSATMNYFGFAWPVKGFLIDAMIDPSEFGRLLDERRTSYPAAMQEALMNLIDSHDTDRLASMIVNRRTEYTQPERFDYDGWGLVSPRNTRTYLVRAPDATDRAIQHLVVLFQMTYVGAPMIYYGTEAGMWGADDPDDRKPMVWADLEYTPERADPLGRPRTPDAVRFEPDVFAFHKALMALRNGHSALRTGVYEQLFAVAGGSTFAFLREDAQETLVVAVNRGSSPATVEIELAVKSARVVYETGAAGDVQVGLEGGFALTLPPLSGAVLAVQRR